jgi:hypothetical protein
MYVKVHMYVKVYLNQIVHVGIKSRKNFVKYECRTEHDRKLMHRICWDLGLISRCPPPLWWSGQKVATYFFLLVLKPWRKVDHYLDQYSRQPWNKFDDFFVLNVFIFGWWKWQKCMISKCYVVKNWTYKELIKLDYRANVICKLSSSAHHNPA